MRTLTLALISLLLTLPQTLAADDLVKASQAALTRAGNNRAEIESALSKVPAEQREGMRFLIAYMPARDLKSLKAEFLLENVRLAYEAKKTFAWGKKIPNDVFFNNVLPYANINEGRDNWRGDFLKRFQPLVAKAKTASEATAILNQKIFPQLKVRYSTKRRRADQAPFETIESGLASCTGLSVLLIDACRSVGIPARFVGTPLWSDKSGNHSWIEVWDDGWHFTGAAEPTGPHLDRAWFLGRASSAKRDHQLHAIYAVSYKRTPQLFPLVWDRSIDYVFAVNVTDRYTNHAKKIPQGSVPVRFRVVDSGSGERVRCALRVYDDENKLLFTGRSNDERFDSNDHLTTPLPASKKYRVELVSGGKVVREEVKVSEKETTLTLKVKQPAGDKKSPPKSPKKHSSHKSPAKKKDADKTTTERSGPVAELGRFLSKPRDKRGKLAEQLFASKPLTASQAEAAEILLWMHHAEHIRKSRAAEMKARQIKMGNNVMPFYYKVFGKAPKSGRSLYISLHGGGGTTKRVNDGQWENQKRLYSLPEGVYLVPRAPTNTWNLWHQGHIDGMFTRLIENLIVFEGVDPNRVYVMGYSAGGDGVYQLAPRMADRFAAAAMMAGHPNETSPLGLRNIAFTIHMGGRDGAYNRNKTAEAWSKQLAELRKADPKGYEHWVKIYPGKGHWMDRQDAAAVPWMHKFNRNPVPKRIVWRQDDVTHKRFYWLAVPAATARATTTVSRSGNTFNIESSSVDKLIIRLNDHMLDMNKKVVIKTGDKKLFEGKVSRSISVIAKTLADYGDPHSVFLGEVTVDLKK